MADKVATIPWAPFSSKHKRYIRDASRTTISIAEGAVRSGKTIDHCIIAAAHLEVCKDKIHLASGSTIANAKLNIGDCNGFGLEHLFRGRCYWGKYRGNDALIILTQTGEKILVFAGGAKANSFQKILGNSYGLWIATEINQHHEKFIQTAFSRQLAAKKRMVLWDLNPGTPTHWIYTSYIEPYRANGVAHYQHFTMDDNMAIPEERKQEIKRQYDQDSVWYKRDILGQRCVAEGLIYRQFADKPEDYILDAPPKPGSLMLITIGVDFGGNKSAHAFVANGLTRGLEQVITLAEHYRKEVITPKVLEADFVAFILRLRREFPEVPVFEVYCDSEATVLIQGLKLAAAANRLPVDIRNALKAPITDRIDFYVSLMAQGRYKIMRGCDNLIAAFKGAVWDEKHVTEDIRLDDGTSNIDSLDAVEYTTERYMRDIQQIALRTALQEQDRLRQLAARTGGGGAK